ncbi:unnamed protein product [Coregonus sp. 'balchen']|nr:unnamed protein product [Coregonus sp. 'balchen']
MDMAAENPPNENKQNRSGTVCSVVISQDPAPQPIIFNPDFLVERLRHERPQVFTELVLSNITRLIDLPGDEFAQLTGEADPRLPTAHTGFLRSLNFLKRKDKGVVFGATLTEEGIAQIYQLIEYLSKKLTQFDEKGNKTSVPDKERQIEAFQLLFMLLPPANHSLLKLLLDLLYHTARNQHNNKIIVVRASDLQGNIKKLNNAVAFLIKHSQKLFRAPAYVKEHACMHFTGSTTSQFTDGLALCGGGAHPSTSKRAGGGVMYTDGTTTSHTHTELALRELYQQVSSMPESAKKKKLIRQFAKQVPGTPVSDQQTLHSNRKHRRSRSFGGIIKRRALGTQGPVEKGSSSTSLVTPGPSSSADRQEMEDISFGWDSSSLKRMCFSPTQETSV